MKYFFQLFVSSSISFMNAFTSLVKFIPKHFMLFDAIVNGIVFLFPLSNRSLLVFRNTADFCILILYSITLPDLFHSNRFFCKVFRIFYV